MGKKFQLCGASIITYKEGKVLLQKRKDNNCWGYHGGAVEMGEKVEDAARRELFEETGAIEFKIKSLFDYSVTVSSGTTYGRVYFSKIIELGKLPDLEIEEVKLFENIPKELTYPEIQPLLYKQVIAIIDNVY